MEAFQDQSGDGEESELVVKHDKRDRVRGGGGGQQLISDKHSGSQRLSGVFITVAPLIISGAR